MLVFVYRLAKILIAFLGYEFKYACIFSFWNSNTVRVTLSLLHWNSYLYHPPEPPCHTTSWSTVKMYSSSSARVSHKTNSRRILAPWCILVALRWVSYVRRPGRLSSSWLVVHPCLRDQPQWSEQLWWVVPPFHSPFHSHAMLRAAGMVATHTHGVDFLWTITSPRLSVPCDRHFHGRNHTQKSRPAQTLIFDINSFLKKMKIYSETPSTTIFVFFCRLCWVSFLHWHDRTLHLFFRRLQSAPLLLPIHPRSSATKPLDLIALRWWQPPYASSFCFLCLSVWYQQ